MHKIMTLGCLTLIVLSGPKSTAHAAMSKGGCLPAGSLVRVVELNTGNQKDVPIESVDPARYRAARSLNDTEGAEIVELVSGQTDQLIKVHLADSRVVTFTPNHPLYLYESDTPARANKICVSDQLVGIDGKPLAIASIARVLGLTKTYNLRTAVQCFFVDGVQVADYSVQQRLDEASMANH